MTIGNNNSLPKIPVAKPRLPGMEALLPYFDAIDQSRIYSNHGPMVQLFESRLSKRLGVAPDGVVTVVNATIGLTMALMEVKRPDCDICLLPSWTFCASAHAAILAGLQPYFVDVDPFTWQTSPDIIRQLPRHVIERAAAVMPVGSFGTPVDAADWDAFALSTGIPVVIDAAAGFDSLVVGRCISVVSLHATKSLGVGEGGFIATQNPELGRAIRQRTNFGFSNGRIPLVAGANAKMSEHTGALGLAGLESWAATRANWKRIRDAYTTALAIARPVWFAAAPPQDWVTATFVVAITADVADAQSAMSSVNIDTRRWWGSGCHREPAFSRFGSTNLSVTNYLAEHSIGLPFFPDISQGEIERSVAEVVKHIHDQPCNTCAVYPLGKHTGANSHESYSWRSSSRAHIEGPYRS